MPPDGGPDLDSDIHVLQYFSMVPGRELLILTLIRVRHRTLVTLVVSYLGLNITSFLPKVV